MSIYTPAPPDQYAVLEGVDHFRKPDPESVPVYSDVHTWSRGWSEAQDSDPRFLEADITALADAVLLALVLGRKRALAKDWRNRKPRIQAPAPSAQPGVSVL